MMEKIWEGNHAGDRAFTSSTLVGRKEGEESNNYTIAGGKRW